MHTTHHGWYSKYSSIRVSSHRRRHRDQSVKMDAETLCAVSGQIGTLVLDRSGSVLSSTGQLLGSAGEHTGKLIFSMLQDTQSLLDHENKEELQRLVVDFSTYDVVVTLDAAHIYVVKRSKAPQSE